MSHVQQRNSKTHEPGLGQHTHTTSPRVQGKGGNLHALEPNKQHLIPKRRVEIPIPQLIDAIRAAHQDTHDRQQRRQQEPVHALRQRANVPAAVREQVVDEQR
jgi:hypothetical protein